MQYKTEIIPVEAKGSEDKSTLFFKKYVSDQKPQHAVRFSKRGYRKGWTDHPYFAVPREKTQELL